MSGTKSSKTDLSEENGAPVLDRRFLARLADDIGDAAATEAAGLFLEDAATRLTAIAAEFVLGRPTSLRREAHALAGAAFAVGLTRLGDAAHALQRTVETTTPNADDIARLTTLGYLSMRALNAWDVELRTAPTAGVLA